MGRVAPYMMVVVAAVVGLSLAPLDDTVRARPRKHATAPARLSETGLYLPGTLTVAPTHLAFAPQYPLWTDGAAKARWIALPPGTKIDTTRLDQWELPIGARLWKEFTFPDRGASAATDGDAGGAEGHDGRRRVETRMIWRAGANEWVFATYLWNEAQTDATLAPLEGARTAVDVGDGQRHVVPGVEDCLACHDAGPSRVLGFNALQLSDDRDPLAPHAEPLEPDMVTNAELARRDLFRPPRPELAAEPPRIAASSPRERAALGYLASNCGHCHNADGPLAPLGLVLAHGSDDGVERTRQSVVDVPGRWFVPGLAPGDSRRVSPGAPDRSALVHRMGSRRPSSQMPPLGTARVDRDALDLITAWITHDLAAPRPSSIPHPTQGALP